MASPGGPSGPALEVEYVKPEALSPAEYNPRQISEAALRRLANLLDAHGFVDPIIARREDGLVIGGHQRLKANALRAKPDERVPVVFLDGIDDARAKALNIALNNPAAQGEYDAEKLTGLLVELNAGELDVPEFTGFGEAELARMFDEQQTGPDGEPAEVQFTPELMESSNYVVFVFGNQFDWNVVEEGLGIGPTKSLKHRTGFEQIGTGRVIDGQILLDLMERAGC